MGAPVMLSECCLLAKVLTRWTQSRDMPT